MGSDEARRKQDSADFALPPSESRFEADCTLHIKALRIRPSAFWSAEFRKAYCDHLTGNGGLVLKPPPLRHASNADWAEFNAQNDTALAPLVEKSRARYPVEIQDTKISGVRVGIVTPRDGISLVNRRHVLINLHAGGFVYFSGLKFGLLESIPVAQMGGITVITVDYRQSPLHKYPAATLDVVAVYRELLESYSADSIGVFGSSAGGVLASQFVSTLQKSGLPLPGAMALASSAPPRSPWPYGQGGDSFMWISEHLPSNELPAEMQALLEPAMWYMEDAAALDSSAFPGSSEEVLRKFPPTLFVVGSREAWMSPVATTHARLLKLGVDSHLYVIEGGWHEAHVLAQGSPESHEANAHIARWLCRRLADAGSEPQIGPT